MNILFSNQRCVTHHWNVIRALAVVTLLVAGFSRATSAQAQITESAAKQIREISAFKQTFSPPEQKMSFNLVLLSRAAHGKLPSSMARFMDKQSLDAKGDAIVEVTGYLSPTLFSDRAMAGVEKVEGQVPAHVFRSGRVRAHVRTSLLLELAGRSDVQSLSNPDVGSTNAGSLTSQGYVAHGANKAIGLGVTGAGVRVGVLSDSASAARVAALIASGDLPPDTVVVPGQVGPATGADEGAAMMEIVHDIAPDAKLFFATAQSTQSQFAANIRTLRFTYGCDIIVDDFTYFIEAAFQDGTIAQAVNDVTADGALYFSSAANSGNLTEGQSGTWEGDYLSSGLSFGPGVAHNFGTPQNPVLYGHPDRCVHVYQLAVVRSLWRRLGRLRPVCAERHRHSSGRRFVRHPKRHPKSGGGRFRYLHRG